MLFNEIGYTAHINERIRERVANIKDIVIPEEFFHSDESKKEKTLIKNYLKDKISNELKKRLIDLRDTDFEINQGVVYKILLPVLEREGKKFKIDIITESEDENGVLKTYSGDLYIVIIASNVGITIMNVNSDEGKASLSTRLIKFMKQGYLTDIKSFSPLEFKINYSLPKEKLLKISEKIKTTQLGDTSLKKYNDLISFIPSNEKLKSVLNEKLIEIDDFLKINLKRLSNSEKKSLESKKKSIEDRISELSTVSQQILDKLKKKADYRKGARFPHDKYGKGTIKSVKKYADGIYNIEVDFPIFGVKTLRVATKQKPEAEVTSGLSESILKLIRNIIVQEKGL